jgi:predicted MPP superfamily phosphohydrolase
MRRTRDIKPSSFSSTIGRVSAFRILQISDTHVSRQKPWFVSNFEAVVAIASAQRPDLVVNTGDISMDGATRDDDLAFAHECHAAFEVPVRAVPGNHDIGDNPWRPDLPQPINEERRARRLPARLRPLYVGATDPIALADKPSPAGREARWHVDCDWTRLDS